MKVALAHLLASTLLGAASLSAALAQQVDPRNGIPFPGQAENQTSQTQNQTSQQSQQTAPRMPTPEPLFGDREQQRLQYSDPLRSERQADTRQAPPVPEALYSEEWLSQSAVFGSSLFQGRFAQESFRGFNPDYLISVGDQVDVQLWGAVDGQLQLQVDAQGNLFIPRVGPVRVVNVRNGELNEHVLREVRKVYREDVGVYATLASAVPVKVFVSGFARRPGLYPGYASDSILNFIDRAGGVDPASGSYLDVRVLRGDKLVTAVNLYDFLTRGRLPQIQLRDGDSIFIGPIGPTVRIEGLVASPAQFEFRPPTSIAQMLQMAGISGRATHVSLTRNQGTRREAVYVPVGDPLLNGPAVTGDLIEVVADRLVGQIAVTLEGEHEGAGQYVLPYSATLADLIAQVKFSEQSRPESLQLFRVSVAARQKQVLDEMLNRLEQAVLSARSATREEAELRTREAELVLQFVERARDIVPKGQVVLPRDLDPSTIALEDGDVVRVPRDSQLVNVHGEVYLPNAFVWRKGYHVRDYINQAGGLIQRSSADRVLLIRQSGEIASENGQGFVMSTRVEPGDEIMILPAVDTKRFQFGKDVVQVIYQIAIAAGVLARL
ncbi:polysaccharide biosynthesis/export family protein [Panacagrimonas sp.]|uniref:polysaccharide biosynthesis/export family protein n=1 Tax=Panacagrimonas sp. TaxID=2480088 RepID=UPI003B526A6C